MRFLISFSWALPKFLEKRTRFAAPFFTELKALLFDILMTGSKVVLNAKHCVNKVEPSPHPLSVDSHVQFVQ
jgi:hypothetical protein